MSRWIGSSTLCALLGLGLCLGTPQAKADINLATAPGLPGAGLTSTNGYTAAFYTDATINALTSGPTGFVGGATAPSATGAPPAGSVAFTPKVVGTDGVFPTPPWILNTAASSWIGPNSVGATTGSGLPNPINGFNPATSAPQGYFYYDKSFDLSTTTARAPHGRAVGDRQQRDLDLPQRYARGCREPGHRVCQLQCLRGQPGRFRSGYESH